jgi:DNA polymerase-4
MRESTFSDKPLKYMFVDFNSYFASVEQQVEPRLRGKPIAVLPTMTDSTCAIAASYEAKAFGIKTGTMIYEAKKMCPDLICVPARHEVYVDYHHKILRETDRHIPIEKKFSIDEYVCELQGKQQTEEGAREIALQLKRGIEKNVGQCIRSSIGIAQNVFLAKVATEIEKPNGLTVLETKDLPHKLLKLKLSDIYGIGRNMEKRLKINNVVTIEDLYRLSPKHMRKIWHSVAGERLYYNLRGFELPDEPTKKRTVGHSHILAPEFRPQKNAKIVAQRLTLKAGSRLRRLGYHAKAIDLSIRIENGPRLTTSRNFYHACDNFTFLGVLNSMWDELTSKTTRQVRIKKISVLLHRLIPNNEIMPEIFDDYGLLDDREYAEKYQKVSYAMDKLNSKYGKDTIVMGFTPDTSTQFSGTKIAFNRIPEIEEFHE